MSRLMKLITGAIGIGLMMTFVIGLSHSVSIGFAGLRGGLPFICVVLFVIGLTLYNFHEDAIRKGRK